MITTTRITLAAALAVVSIRLIEHGLNIHLNGTSAEVTGAVTVIFERLLRLVGITDTPPNDPPADPPPA